MLNPYNQLGGDLVKDTRTFEEVVKNLDDILEEMGPIPDNTADNRRRLLAIEKQIAKLGFTYNLRK